MSSDEAMPWLLWPSGHLHYSPYHIWAALRPPLTACPLSLFAGCGYGNLQCFQAPLPGGKEVSLARAGLPRGYLGCQPRTRAWCARSHDRVSVACMHMHTCLPPRLIMIYTLLHLHIRYTLATLRDRGRGAPPYTSLRRGATLGLFRSLYKFPW